MDSDQYIKDRVDDQIQYYDLKSKSCQQKYKSLSGAQIFCGAFIPLISGFSNEIPYAQWMLAGLGVVVALSTGFLSLGKYQEHWMNYRTTCETLRHLKILYLTKSAPYENERGFDRFVTDVEFTISKENSDWMNAMARQEKKAG